jgi:hypothetical protein
MGQSAPEDKMKRSNKALATVPNPEKEKTTWGAVCKQVGMSDNLYRTCRDKLGNEFQPNSPFGDYDYEGDDDEPEEDFEKQLKKSALPVPAPPPEDWKHEPEGLMEQLMYGDLPKKMMIYGGGALVLWFLWDKYMKHDPRVEPTPHRTGLIVPNVPTTVQIPASLMPSSTP